MAVSKSSLSAGILIHSVLTSNAEVAKRSLKVYPVVDEEKAVLPYIVYKRLSLGKGTVKSDRGNDTATISVQCYTGEYTEGVELAEAVRDALDGKQIALGGIVMRACDLADSDEDWAADAFVQTLIFTCKM